MTLFKRLLLCLFLPSLLITTGCSKTKNGVNEKAKDYSGTSIKITKKNVLNYLVITPIDTYVFANGQNKYMLAADVAYDTSLLLINMDFETIETHELIISSVKNTAQTTDLFPWSSFHISNELYSDKHLQILKFDLKVTKADGEARFKEGINAFGVDLNLYNFKDYFSFYFTSEYFENLDLTQDYFLRIALSKNNVEQNNHYMLFCKDVSLVFKIKYLLKDKNQSDDSYKEIVKTIKASPNFYGLCISQQTINVSSNQSFSLISVSLESVSGTVFESTSVDFYY